MPLALEVKININLLDFKEIFKYENIYYHLPILILKYKSITLKYAVLC